MELDDVGTSLRVKTTFNLQNPPPAVQQQYIDARKADAEGVVIGRVPGHENKTWWVRHDDNSVGAYSHEEFDGV